MQQQEHLRRISLLTDRAVQSSPASRLGPAHPDFDLYSHLSRELRGLLCANFVIRELRESGFWKLIRSVHPNHLFKLLASAHSWYNHPEYRKRRLAIVALRDYIQLHWAVIVRLREHLDDRAPAPERDQIEDGAREWTDILKSDDEQIEQRKQEVVLSLWEEFCKELGIDEAESRKYVP